MNKKDQYKRIVSFGSAILLMCLLAGVFGFIWYELYSDAIILPFYRRGNWVLIAIYVILVAIFFKAYGGFKVGYLKRTDMLYSQILSMLCVNTVSYFLISLIGRQFLPVYPIVFMTLLDFVILFLWTYLVGALYFIIYPPRRLALLYGSHQAASLVLKMSSRVDKYMICEAININEDASKIKDLISKYEGVIICDIPAEPRNDYLKFCFQNSIRAYIAPKISDIIIRGAEDIRLFDTPLLLCRNYGLTFEQRMFKRCLDVLLSGIVCIPVLPIMLICSLCIKLYDHGPVFYKQKRLTFNGKEFYVYKFRSMIVDAEKNGVPQLSSDEDSRITPVGKILRKYRLDEIPQLINILKGDMSIVGPRPERPELTEAYKKSMPEFEYRLKVKAGLTGYAQVTGVYDTTPYDKLKMDLMYIENYSIRMDLQIILMTVKTMLFPGKSNAEAKQMLTPSDFEKDKKEGN